MTPARNRHPGQSALSAFRADITGTRSIRPSDDGIVTVAALLRQASLNPGTTVSDRLLERAAVLAAETVGPAMLSRGCFLEERDHSSPLDVFRLLAELCDEQALFSLQAQLLDSLTRLAPPGTLVAARIHYRRVRSTFNAGDHAFADLMLEEIMNSESGQFTEVRLLERHSRATNALSRGNLPAVREFSEEILRMAGDGYPSLRAQALDNIAIYHAMRGEHNAGLQRHWEAYRLVNGTGTLIELKITINMAIMVLDSGHPGQARPALASLLHRPLSPSALYGVIGAYTEASSKMGDNAGVEWGVAEVLRLASQFPLPRMATQTLFECALALGRIGESTRAEALMSRVVEMAENYGFHDLPFRAEQAESRKAATPTPLDPEATVIVAEVERMEPGVRPETLEYAG